MVESVGDEWRRYRGEIQASDSHYQPYGPSTNVIV